MSKNIQVEGDSLIAFELRKQDTPPQTDWIFFTSKNSVKYYFGQGHSVEGLKVGCVGKGTKAVLSKYVQQIDYMGNHVDTQVIGNEFSELVGEASCLFPVSNISKRTIQKHMLNQHQVYDFVVYDTKTKEQSTANLDADLVIVTSPSNASAYVKLNGKNAQFIAMGKTTGQHLEELGIKDYMIPKIPGEIGLIDCIQQFT